MGMDNFHWRSAVLSAVNNTQLLIRPGVLHSWFVTLRDGDLYLMGDEIVRCGGISFTLNGTNIVAWEALDGSAKGSTIVQGESRVEKLDLIGYSAIKRFLDGTQPQFISDVKGSLSRLHRPLTPAERERQRRANETPAQADERRRKNRDNMRRKRAEKKG